MKSTLAPLTIALTLVGATTLSSSATESNAAPSPLPIAQRALQPPDVGSADSPRGGGVRFTPPSLPPGIDGPGGSRSGGGSRNLCPSVNAPLTALVPIAKRGSTAASRVSGAWGLTVDSRPEFWIYVPYSQRSSYKAELVLQDTDENDLYRGEVALPSKPGVISVRLPATAPALEVGQPYTWYFNFYCDRTRNAPITVEGAIQRISPNPTLAQQIASAQPREQVALYASSGIWFNALTTLGNLRRANPNNAALAKDWADLLQAIDLEKIAREPLVKQPQ